MTEFFIYNDNFSNVKKYKGITHATQNINMNYSNLNLEAPNVSSRIGIVLPSNIPVATNEVLAVDFITPINGVTTIATRWKTESQANGLFEQDINNNIFGGTNSGQSLTTGTNNFLAGVNTGGLLTDGLNNIVIGNESLRDSTNSSNNILLGTNLMLTGNNNDENIIIGNSIIQGLDVSVNNTIIGHNCLTNLTTGNYNIVIGKFCLEYNPITRCDGNIIIGLSCLEICSNSFSNIAIGETSGKNLTEGTSNIMMGANSGFIVASGDDNIFLGTYIDNEDTPTNILNRNISIGYRCRSGGNGNILIGDRPGRNLLIGTDNIILGNYNNLVGSPINYSFSVIIGGNSSPVTTTSAFYSVLIGHDSSGTSYSTAIGYDVHANSANSISIGRTCSNEEKDGEYSSTSSICIGMNITNRANYNIILCSNPTRNSTIPVTADSLFQVEIGSGVTNKVFTTSFVNEAVGTGGGVNFAIATNANSGGGNLPTNSGQSRWLKINLDGTDYFIPLWT